MIQIAWFTLPMMITSLSFHADIIVKPWNRTKRWRETGLPVRRFGKYLVQENLTFYLSFWGFK
ncbi:MAG TPA: hypothetical protein VJ879_08085, partial [Desulfobacter sp.]|nr:hypothetical protein [Desulfobacter sp.]